MFDGAFRRSRKVNLSGKTSFISEKNQFLQHAKLERQERLLERTKIHAVLKIQRQWRRVSIHLFLRKLYAKEWNMTFKQIQMVLKETDSFPIHLFHTMVRLLHRWKSLSTSIINDDDESDKMQTLSIKEAMIETMCMMERHKEQYWTWSFKHQKEIWLFQMASYCKWGMEIIMQKEDKSVMTFLRSCLCNASWDISSNQAYQQALQVRVCHSSTTLFTGFVHCCMKRISMTSSWNDMLHDCLKTVCENVPSGQEQQHILSTFFVTVFGCPLLFDSDNWKQAMASWTDFHVITFWNQVLNAILPHIPSIERLYSLDHQYAILGNVVALATVLDLKIPKCATTYVHILSNLLSTSFLYHSFSKNNLLEEENDDEDISSHNEMMENDEQNNHDDESIAYTLFSVHQQQSKLMWESSTSNADHDDIATQIQLLTASSTISSLFLSILKNEEANDASVLQLCTLYTSLIAYTGGSLTDNSAGNLAGMTRWSSTILNAIAFTPRVVSLLWKWLHEHYFSTHLISSGEVSNEVQMVLYVFVTSYSRDLCTLEDQSFYTLQEPLRLKDNATLALGLKFILYRMYWADAGKETGFLDLSFLLSCTKLFNQLYDRTNRRSFCSLETWHWPDLPVPELDISQTPCFGTHQLGKVLRALPQVVPFPTRVHIFHELLQGDKNIRHNTRNYFQGYERARVRRDFMWEDTLSFFKDIHTRTGGAALKSRMQITFVNEQGLEEAGIDGGGVFKEFMDTLCKRAFDPQYGLFSLSGDQLLYPNAASLIQEDQLDLTLQSFYFLGQILGKAVYEEILVEPQFATFFLNKLLGKVNYIDDLQSLDPELYRHLLSLKTFTGNMEELCLNFSIDRSFNGQTSTVDLIPNGSEIPVTMENRIRYVHVLANYRLNVEMSLPSRAFLSGFRNLIPTGWIRLFSPEELQMVIGGSSNKVDVDDWMKNTNYGGGYHPSQKMIIWFWEVVDEFTSEQQGQLLKFITSCSRQPLLGFGRLAPLICIHQVRINDDERLPSSSTCMNLLKLPTYSSKSILYHKLNYAITAKAGFELS